MFKVITGTLQANHNTMQITDDTITNNSIFEVYADTENVIPSSVSVGGHTVTVTFDSKPSNNVGIKVLINNIVGEFAPSGDIYADDVIYINPLMESDNVKDTLDIVVNSVIDIDTELHTDTIQGGVLYHNTSGNVWKRLTGSDVDYDENTTINEKLDEVFTSVSNGKSVIASAITDKGVPTLANDTFQTMANHIAEIESGGSGGGQTYFKFYDPVGGTKVDTFTSTMNGTLKLVAVGYMDNFATIKINDTVISPTESYYITSHYYYYVYVETQINKNDVIEVSGTATGTSSFSILASIVGTGMDIADTTAIESDVLSGKIFYKADGSKAWGTYAEPSIIPLTVRVDELQDLIISLPSGGYNPVTYGLAEEEKEKIIPKNIKKDVTILGVTGTLESGSNVKNGTITLTTTNQTIICGFKPTQVCVCVGANRTTYFGFGINTNGITVGSRLATSGASSATSPVTITLTDDGFTVKALSSSYTLASTYYALG